MDRVSPPRRARGRPRTFEPADVVEAAMAVFWRQGYQNTRLEQIEEPLSLSRSSLYHEFGSKERLFQLVLEHYVDRLLVGWIHPLRDGGGGLDDIITFFGQLDRQARHALPAPGCLMVNTMAEFGGGDGEVRRIRDRYLRELRGAFGAALERAAARGETEPADITWRTELLVGAVLGISLAARSGTPVAQVRRLVSAIRTQVEAWRHEP